MSVFPSGEMAADVFGRLFTVLLENEQFVEKARKESLSVHLVHSRPDCRIFVSPDGVVVGGEAPSKAAITLKMSCDTAHALWLGRLPVPAAIATGKLRIRGRIAKVLELVPLLQPAFDRYPEIAADAGV
ncbi:SCP2 sterol-binding domain-containing protein [Streptomyces sp. NPDC005803]|uniref:SCP2 sterol-binding domain-containing protein n=1 Tax=Streptomyces sp. NPDC005803 TaxID=3154297 RepID=UPI0033E0C3C2